MWTEKWLECFVFFNFSTNRQELLSILFCCHRVPINFNVIINACVCMIFRLQEINYDSPRGRVAMRTHSNEWTTSYLLIHDADINDSGVYVCAPTSGGRTSIKVHVFLHGNIGAQHVATTTTSQTKFLHTNKYFPQANTNFISSSSFPFFATIRLILIYVFSFSFAHLFFSIFIHIWSIVGERPEAMQTGTSTYIANNIMQTILISIIISTYNIFQNYYTNILFSSRIPNEITWQTRAIMPKLFGHRTTLITTATAAATAGTSLVLNQNKPYEMSRPARW